jgi:hypothetical protein
LLGDALHYRPRNLGTRSTTLEALSHYHSMHAALNTGPSTQVRL